MRLASTLDREVPRKRHGDVGVRFVSANAIRKLNRAYRGKDRVTDVLSFEASTPSLSSRAIPTPFAANGVSSVIFFYARKERRAKKVKGVGRAEGSLRPVCRDTSDNHALGDLAVCASYARREARRRGILPREELLRLLAHGVLHLTGWDHETEKDEATMFKKQERAVSRAL